MPGSTQDRINQRLPAQQDQAQGTGSLPEGNVRWRILDFDDNEVRRSRKTEPSKQEILI